MGLRPFDPRYAELVAGWATTAQEVALLSGREKYPFPGELRSVWRKVEDGVRSFLYCDGARAIGYAELWLDAEEDEVELARIILAPEYRGKGLGPAFVDALLAQALATGLTDIFLRVRPDNTPALRTYLRVGFRQVADELAAEWNQEQPIPYTWMQYPAERPPSEPRQAPATAR